MVDFQQENKSKMWENTKKKRKKIKTQKQKHTIRDIGFAHTVIDCSACFETVHL